MELKPRFRGFICTNAHPEGCKEQVRKQIDFVQQQPRLTNGPKNVLVIGASKGFGLSARIVSAFGAGASTIGVFSGGQGNARRGASAGWYNSMAFEEFAHQEGLYAKHVNGDAFSNEIKEETIQLIKQDLGKIDLVIYSLATAKRIDPQTGKAYYSVLKPIGTPYHNKTVHFHTGEVTNVEIQPANEEEISDTVKVMGGEDWRSWMLALKEADVLSQGVKTIAFSYIGPEMTHPIYRNGTIGRAKDHLEATAHELSEELSSVKGQAIVTVCKGLVTQSSTAIPVIPLYISALYKVMKEKEIHEGCIEQMNRLYQDFLYSNQSLSLDEEGRIRIDDWEMRADVQQEVAKILEKVNSENVYELTDLKGFREDFFHLFGFEADQD
ncbi:enoyl-ACP reductase FabV [Thermoactinomyces sp. DSM 45892]|uniref:enoyl-ACP reductase FabV n=1 Tax=Thermoactinomyces sp. DSM 45892 TaxID=1882753 RepID=UPI00089AFBBB|nr:enoyl-ACP reductase FabV [Thermoactinomyces sp. DSM 45892]SDY58270.1 enoyl-[acyl-carrier protein] reductase / trans-2-enoyl-CoA reductase (NAD+) [Thermoactinomyces sp. DSM 45892]